MRRISIAAAILALWATRPAHAQTEQQALVDRSTLAVQEIMAAKDGLDAQALIRKARGVIVCPRIFRAGFLLGGSGGDCVLSARDSQGNWSSPAFYGIGSGSIGLQAGIQDAEVLMLILTDRGLSAVLDSQFKFGGDASASIGTLGNFIQGATTANAGADIVVTGKTRGLFAGLTLEGSLLRSQTESNRAFYGRDYGARQVVADAAVANPGAAPLREILARYAQAPQAAAVPPAGPSTPYTPAPYGTEQSSAYGARAPVTAQSLPPPR